MNDHTETATISIEPEITNYASIKKDEISKKISVTGITLTHQKHPNYVPGKHDKPTLYLDPGENGQLIAEIQPENASNKKIRWQTDNPEIAVINDKGIVTAINYGYTTVVAKTEDGEKTATYEIDIIGWKE
jgi:uncharacterized protein YjdB